VVPLDPHPMMCPPVVVRVDYIGQCSLHWSVFFAFCSLVSNTSSIQYLLLVVFIVSNSHRVVACFLSAITGYSSHLLVLGFRV